MKIKLIKKYWDDRYEYHITKPEKSLSGDQYDYVAIRVTREDTLPRNERGSRIGTLGPVPMESDEQFEARAITLFNQFVLVNQNIKQDIIIKEVEI